MPMQQWIPPGIMSGGVPLPQPPPTAANTPPGPQGPLWLQKFAGGFNKFANGLSGYAPSPYLSDAENQALQQRQRAATFAQLAASSGPTVAGTTGPLQAFGQATGAGLQAGQQGVEDTLKARLLHSQMNKPIEVPAGGTLFDPTTRQPIFSSPASETGINSRFRTPQVMESGRVGVIDGQTGRLKYADSGDFVPATDTVSAHLQVITLPDGSMQIVDMRRGLDGKGGGETPPPPRTAPLVSPDVAIGGAANKAAAEARARTLGEKQAGAEYDLPRQINNATQALDVIDSLKKHPGLPYITGWYSKAPVVPNTDQASADALAQQVEGKTFLEAYNALRGGGQITEIEGKKATAAIARLYRAQSTEDYKSALDDLQGVIKTGLDRAKTQAGQTGAGSSALPSGVTEADITETMRANNMTRAQVLQKLNAR